MAVLLEVIDVSKKFGGLQATKNVSFDIEKGKITCVIGPNGAGKTTLFNMITGFIPMDCGEVILDGLKITGMPPHKIAKHGLTRTFQLVRVFPRMTLLDNIMLGYNDLEGDSLYSSLIGSGRMRKAYKQKIEEAKEILNYLGLSQYTNSLANDLSYGQQKLVEIGRTLVSQPKVLLLDEPLAGLNVKMIEKVLELINDIKRKGNTLVIIEHNMQIVLDISDYIHVLNFGELIASGTPKEIIENEKVIDSYLGRN